MAFIREVLKASLNASRSVQIELISITLGSSQWFMVRVNGQTEEAEAAIADGDEWDYKTLEKALIAFDELSTRWAWFGAGSAPAVVTPVSVGLTVDTMKTYRAVLGYGMPWAMVMKHLQRIYQANKATSERGIDWADSIYKGSAF